MYKAKQVEHFLAFVLGGLKFTEGLTSIFSISKKDSDSSVICQDTFFTTIVQIN